MGLHTDADTGITVVVVYLGPQQLKRSRRKKRRQDKKGRKEQEGREERNTSEIGRKERGQGYQGRTGIGRCTGRYRTSRGWCYTGSSFDREQKVEEKGEEKTTDEGKIAKEIETEYK